LNNLNTKRYIWPYGHKNLEYNLSTGKTPNQNTVSNINHVLIGRFLSTSIKLVVEHFITIRPGALFN